MEYRLTIGRETANVHVVPEEENLFHFSLDEREMDVTSLPLSAGMVHMTVAGQGVRAFVADREDGKEVFVRGRSFLIQDADQLPSRGRRTSGQDLPREVTPPMPSIVVRILVQEGDRVQKGQGLVVVSAMKMETTLISPRDGLVTRIHTAVEARVAPGDILVEIEEGEAS